MDTIPEWRARAGWSPRQRHLLTAADELHHDQIITDATWELLSAELRDSELIELCFLVGHYEMLAMTLNSLGVQPEPLAVRALSARAAGVAAALQARLGNARGSAS